MIIKQSAAQLVARCAITSMIFQFQTNSNYGTPRTLMNTLNIQSEIT